MNGRLFALSLGGLCAVLFACGGGGGKAGTLGSLAETACACKDKACMDKAMEAVKGEIYNWDHGGGLEAFGKWPQEDKDAFKAARQKAEDCAAKVK